MDRQAIDLIADYIDLRQQPRHDEEAAAVEAALEDKAKQAADAIRALTR